MKPLQSWKLICACGALGVLGCGGVTSRDATASAPAFIAVGSAGAILSSRDGRFWQTEASGTNGDLRSVAAGRTGFVVVGTRGLILSSARGDDWTERRSGTDVDLTHVIFTGEQFVAVGGDFSDGALALTSTDGAAWARVEGPPHYSFRAVALAGSSIVAAAVKPSEIPMALDNAVVASVPPSTSNRGGWIERQAPSFSDSLSVRDEALTVGSYAGTSTLSRSSDGEKWATLELPTPDARSIASSGSRLVIVGGSSALDSTDGRDWSTHELGRRQLMAVAYGAEAFVAVGYQGHVTSSADGVDWIEHATAVAGTGVTLADIAFGPLP
jgi:hypothetical protein